MGYWTGAFDGLFDPATGLALIAFQKWEGRPVTARLTLDELEAIRISNPPKAQVNLRLRLCRRTVRKGFAFPAGTPFILRLRLDSEA
jgi:peptidoglycan hydrolase-like protein with peptidoglycan-binding domain